MNGRIIAEAIFVATAFLAAVYAAIMLYRYKKIPVIFYYALSIMSFSGLELLGIIYKFDWSKAPIEFCYFQALAQEFSAFAIGGSIFIFTLQTYRLLVLRVRNELTDSRWRKFYAMFLIIYPIAGTTVVSILTVTKRAVRVTDFNCMVLEPIWVRLMGSSGPNAILSIIGIYLGCHATLAVIRHLRKFNPQTYPALHGAQQNAVEKNEVEAEEVDPSETQSSGKAIVSDSNLSDNHTLVMQISAIDVESTSNDSNKTRFSRPVSSKPAFKVRNARYNVTKAVIFRMVIFISSYIIVNIDVAISFIFSIIKRAPVDVGERYICATIGIMICLIFGTTDKVINRFSSKWVPSMQLCSREKVTKKENEELDI